MQVPVGGCPERAEQVRDPHDEVLAGRDSGRSRAAVRAGALDAGAYQVITTVRGFGRREGRNQDALRARARRGRKKADPLPLPLELARRLKYEHPDTPQGRRDAAILCLLLDHGLRCGELAELEVGAFALGGGPRDAYMRFYRRKVDKVQTHRLTEDAHAAVRRYLEADRAGFADADAAYRPFLCGSRRGGRLTHVGMLANSLSDRVRELGRRIVVADGATPLAALSPHDCRHYWATMAFRAGSDVKAVQEAGGWSSAAMPMLYALAAEVANERVALLM